MGNKKMKTSTFVLLVVAASVLLTAVFVAAAVLLISCLADAAHIEDINGEDKTLAVITREKIESGEYSQATFMSGHSSKGYNASGVGPTYRDYDNTYSRLSAKKLSGIRIENTCLGNGSSVEYTVESSVASGNFQIFIVDEDFHILRTVAIDGSDTVTLPTEKGKLYHVIYAGESAEIEVKLWRRMG